jgi:hypothetical protein
LPEYSTGGGAGSPPTFTVKEDGSAASRTTKTKVWTAAFKPFGKLMQLTTKRGKSSGGGGGGGVGGAPQQTQRGKSGKGWRKRTKKEKRAEKKAAAAVSKQQPANVVTEI